VKTGLSTRTATLLLLGGATMLALLALPARRTEPAKLDLATLVAQATPAAGAPAPEACAELRAAVVEILARDARAFTELVPAWRRAGAELRGELLAAVAERADPAGLDFLAWVATYEGLENGRGLAEACLALAPRASGPEARESLERLCVLLESEDDACVQTAVLALSRARVDAAVPAWIELLERPSRAVRERARRALEQHSGLALGAAPERWRAWHDAELAWLEDEAPAVLAELELDDDARVLAALRALAPRRLARDELALAVAATLDHPHAVVRAAACSALESLAVPAALPALALALDDEDEAVARGAWSALRRLTGLDLPFDPAPWREHLGRG